MKKNVLFVSIDDMMNVVRYRDAYGVPFDTPNIDRLLDAGVFFNSAYALVAECNPSRASTLTGQSIFRTHVEQNGQNFFEHVDPATTLPHLFREAGYETAGVGKIFHDSIDRSELNTEAGRYLRGLFDVFQPTVGENYGGDVLDILDSLDPTPLPESRLADRKSADWAAGYIEQHPSDRPWFLSVGFMKPHPEWHAPRKYFDRYPISEIETPATDHGSLESLSPFVKQFFNSFVHREIVSAGVWDDAIRAYMASVSYVDAQLGRLLHALDRTDAWSSTTVVLWSDHGFHLGEQETWGKFTHWEHGTNAPLIIVDPDVGTPGTVVHTPVSLLDIFPTLTELAGIDDTTHRDGHSLVSLMRDPDAAWGHFAGTIMNGSISLRTERYRYIASLDGSEQLYDMRRDPEQRANLADRAEHADDLRELRARAVQEVEELGGHLRLRTGTLRGTDGIDGFMLTPNVDHAAGGPGDDVYHAIDPRAVEEARGEGHDTLRLFAPKAGHDIDVRVPTSVELTIVDRSAGGRVVGTRDADQIVGDRLAVHFLGKAGDDQLVGGGGTDHLEGGAGRDRLRGLGGEDKLAGGSGGDKLFGGRKDDVLSGGGGGDILAGGNGADRLSGGFGDDLLRGNQGPDRLRGDEGRDTLKGGRGADVYSFAVHAGTDEIIDFVPGQDGIDLTALNLDGLQRVQRGTSPEGWAVARIPDADVAIVLRHVEWSDLDASDFLS